MLRITTNADMVNAKVGLALAAVICIGLWGVRNVISGRVPRPSLATALIAIFCAAAILHFRQMLLRVALAMAGAQAVVRVAPCPHAPTVWQYAAAVGGETITDLAAIIAIFVIVKWADPGIRKHPPSDRESPA